MFISTSSINRNENDKGLKRLLSKGYACVKRDINKYDAHQVYKSDIIEYFRKLGADLRPIIRGGKANAHLCTANISGQLSRECVPSVGTIQCIL